MCTHISTTYSRSTYLKLHLVAAVFVFVSHTPRTVTTPYEIVFNQAGRYDIGNGGGFTKKRKEKNARARTGNHERWVGVKLRRGV